MKLRSLAFAVLLFVALPLTSSLAYVGVSINIAPPILPVVAQPYCPVEGYIWTPGYWAYSSIVGYYWVPGAWVAPPGVGLLWTPPYWGFNNGVYIFNDGYWGPTVGFYGGINYGYGYFGSGYWGGRWDRNVFRYNTAVSRVNTTVIRNTFVDRSVLSKQVKGERASFNGPNGVKAEATAEEKAAAQNARKMPATSQQVARQEAASKNRDLQASVNKGRPKAAAIKSLDKEGQQAKGTEGREAATEKLENKAPETGKKTKAEAGLNKKENAAKAESSKKEEESAEHHREKAANAENREVGTRSSKAAEHEGPARGRHEMTGKSRRPEAGAARPQGEGKRGQAPGQQKGKKKGAKPEPSPNG
jgi:hypothetical protein